MTATTTFTAGQRVYSSTGDKSHVIQAVTRDGKAVTRCGRDATHEWYSDQHHSLSLCVKCKNGNLRTPPPPAQVRPATSKRCRDCRKRKPLGAYGESQQSRDGRRSTCLACTRVGKGGPVAGDPKRPTRIVNPPTWLDRWQKEAS